MKINLVFYLFIYLLFDLISDIQFVKNLLFMTYEIFNIILTLLIFMTEDFQVNKNK